MSKKRIRAVLGFNGLPFDKKTMALKPPSWLLPATADAYEQMVDQMAHGFCASDDFVWDGIHYNVAKYYNRYARAALRAIGIKPIKK